MRGYSARARAIAGVVATVALAAAIVLPAFALAKTTFSAKAPVSGSSSVITKPTISIYIVDTYGIKGTTSFSMKIDGKTVKPKITYKINKKKRDYKRVTLSFRVTASLRVGPHTVVVKIKNTRKKTATVTWKFTVKSPPRPPAPPQPTTPDPMPVTIAASNCGACHVGYAATHPMTQCGLCHGNGRPQGEPSYSSGDESAHTLGCALEVPCHGSGGAFPHALDADCARCHSGVYAGIGVRHASIEAEAAHATTSAGCTITGCHLASLTLEHYRRSVAGAKLSCATCHSSASTRVIAAIRARSTDCGGCHSLTSAHAIPAGSHTASNACVAAGCHVASVITVHGATGGPGCDACHAAGRTPSLVCASCHTGSANQVHSKAAVAHTATAGTCVTALCHLADVTAIHGVPGGPGCLACHAAGKTPSADCATCHPGALDAIHPRIGTAHTAPVDGCVSSVCHARDVTTVHGAPGGPGCAACHEAGVSARIACASCHAGDLTGRHSSATAKHTAASSNGCVSAACHPANVAALHGVAGGPGCAACHGPGKVASTTCSPCHSSDMVTVHPLAVTKHTAPVGTCVSSSCHAASVTAIHGAPEGPGCPACHAAGKTLSVVCTACHTTDLVALHPVADAKHSAPLGICAQPACHTANAAVIHRALAGSGCSTCHAPGKTPSLVCATCHPGDLTPRHPSANGAHTAPASSCVTTGCHIANAATVHGAVGGPGCAACHAPGKTPSLVCATCHPGGVASLHASATAKHAAPKSTCVQSGCHGADTATLHTQVGGPGCAACHAAGKTASILCADCHSGDLTPRHPSAVTAHRAPASSCVTAGCHTADAATLHSAAGGPGCAACHAPGKTPSLTCATCHPGNIATLHASSTAKHASAASTCVQVGCHVTDAATIHTQTGGPGCAACHAAGVTASIVCVSCHTGDLTSRHASATLAHTAAAGLCVSSTCHVTNVATIHAAGLGCIDCHGIGRTPSLVCATCHGADLVSLHPVASARHATTASCVQAGCHLTDAARIHAAAGGPGCPACHKAGTTPVLTCVTCHPGGFTPAHPAPAAAHTAPAGSCVTAGCHVADAAGPHTKIGGPGCAACHKTGTTPTLVCVSCHSGDVAALHPNAAASHASPASSCVKAGCHVSDVVAVHGAPGGPGCIACHTLGKTPSVVCGSCHLGHGFTLHTGFAAAHSAPVSTCVLGGCHAPDVVYLHGAGNGGTGCTACHPVHAPAGSPGCAACHAAGKTPSIGCADCHSTDLRIVHPLATTKHAAPAGDCVKPGCHASSVAALHAAAGGPGCVACHDTGKTPTLVCSACHSTNLTTVHPLAAGKHGAPASDCVKAGCHVVDVTAVHGAVGGPGCAACHDTGKTPSLVCATCHVGSTQALHPLAVTKHAATANTSCVRTGCHGSDIAGLHAVPGGPGCVACHAAGKTPAITCATCHPGTTFVVHARGNVPHVAPNGTCVQTGCHVASVVTLHIGGPGCVPCHAPGVTPTVQCTACHGVDPATVHAAIVGTKHTASASTCTATGCHNADVAAPHGKTGGPGCAVCHAVGKTPSVDCTICHGSFTSSHPVPAAAHTSPAGGPCSGCHDSNVATLHGVTGGPSCGACHTTAVTPSTTCADCHSTGIAARHPTGDVAHSPRVHPCTDACHGTNVAAIHATSARSCAICHASGTALTANCTASTCHPLQISYLHVDYPMVSEFHSAKSGTGWADWGWSSDGTIRAPYTRGVSLPCATCHVPAGTTNEYNFPTTVNGRSVTVTKDTELMNLCVACHGGTLGDWHQGCFDCHGSGMGDLAGPKSETEFRTRYGTDCTQCHQHGGYGWPHGPGWMTGATL